MKLYTVNNNRDGTFLHKKVYFLPLYNFYNVMSPIKIDPQVFPHVTGSRAKTFYANNIRLIMCKLTFLAAEYRQITMNIFIQLNNSLIMSINMYPFSR